ncbi:alpha/beta hydrolase family protein [Streptomyces sp. NPDC048496]|uniref:alpha/beta hydrolase family protein n=1 Tax=Streptomyces sp. NPDC048496 TaxID=3365558 RepID=UPI003711B19B
MTSYLDLPDVLPEFVFLNRSRTGAAGLDPFEYERVTAQLGSLYDWPAAFHAAGRAHLAAAEAHETQGHMVSAGESYRLAARWFHCAVLLPHPDRELAARAAAESDEAMRRAHAHLDRHAVRIKGSTFTGWLRGPHGAPVVIVIPGLDSGKEEFHGVTEALLGRDLAVFAMDGPGQGVLAVKSTPRPDYQHVITEVIDTIEARTVGLIGLSLGGYYAAVSAAHEPRVRAVATVSGPSWLDWDELPVYVTDTLTQRAGTPDAAREFARGVDLRGVAERIACPLRVIDGGTDTIPGVANGKYLAAAGQRGEYVVVPHGDHLVGNARTEWLPGTADWLSGHLTH